jgi:hypothetical protein
MRAVSKNSLNAAAQVPRTGSSDGAVATAQTFGNLSICPILRAGEQYLCST